MSRRDHIKEEYIEAPVEEAREEIAQHVGKPTPAPAQHDPQTADARLRVREL